MVSMKKHDRSQKPRQYGPKKIKKKKKKIIQSEQQYRRIFECSPQVIGIVDNDGTVLDVNQRIYDWLGYKSDEIIGTNFMELPFLPEESKTLAEEKLYQMALGKDEPLYEMTFMTKKGEKRVGQVLSNPIRDGQGRMDKLLVMARDITGWKKAKEALRTSEELFRSIVENSHAGIGMIDDAFKVVYANDQLCRIVGYRRREIIGQDFRKFLDEDSKQLVADRYVRRQQGEKILPRYEFGIVRKDGERRRIEIVNTVIKNQFGGKRTLSQMLDITEQKQAEKALRQSEKDYRGLFENAHDAIFVFTPDKEFILDVNPRACEMYGFKRDEFIGMSLEDISKDVPLGKKRIKKTLKEGSFHSFETIHYKKDGSQIFLDINAAVVDYKGQQAILSINRDITDRKRAEEKLRLEKAHLDQLFESAQEGIVMSDKEGKILSVNSEFTRLFGYSREELLGRNVDEQVMSRKEFHRGHSITKKVADGENVNFEAIRQRKDGRLIHVSVLASPIVLDGEVVAIYAIYRDITERKLSEEKIKAALREREVMLREIHHRVKNNMQIISSLLRLQSRQIKNKRILDIFNVGQNRIRSMALIHESLYQSKDLSRINFADYIKRLTTHLFSMYRIGAERVQLKVDVGEVFLDINRAIPCGLIVNELVSNSLKHAFPNGQEGKIVVKMNGNSRGKISLIVKDSGIGFPEDLDFKKTETLGMQLVTDLVAQIDGKIKLMKEQGTEFRVVF